MTGRYPWAILQKKQGAGAMAGKLARGAFLVILAVMVVSWAVSISNSSPAEPQNALPTDRMYS